MSITQTVEVPASRRLILDVPCEIPTGPVVLTFTPATAERNKVPVFDCAKGQFSIMDDYDESLEDFEDYM